MPARPSARTAIARIAVILALLAVSLPGGANARPPRGPPPPPLGLRTDVPDRPHRPLRSSAAPLRGHPSDRGDGQVRRRPIASYAGEIPGLRQPAPPWSSWAPSMSIPPGSRRTHVPRRPDGHDRGAIRRTVPAARLLRTFSIVYGGASLLVPAGQIRDLLMVPGVVAVQRDRLAHTTVGDHSASSVPIAMAESRRSAAGGVTTSSWG